MKTPTTFISFFLLLFCFTVYSQSDFNYEISLVPVSIPDLSGLHSYAFAQYQDKCLIIGGRKDGIHARQPFNAFAAASSNTDIYVIDIANAQFWSASVNNLPAPLREQLQSTNMNFYQDEDTLYIIGGYGFSATANDHITYPYLTSINVPDLINAIQNDQNIALYFKQTEDDIFAVTGGHLKKLNGLFYLVGGQRFDGRYNPMGHDTYTQTYTNQIRKFSIQNTDELLSYSDYDTLTDPVHLRRRDYNLLPQIFPNGEAGFMIASGVFQINADLPFLYPVEIRESGYQALTDFNQYLSNYHSATAHLYDSIGNNMHSIFFGGMSQYYYQNGNLIQDTQVPFVKTISRLSRDAAGTLSEHQFSIEMPALQGAGAEFIPNLNLPHYPSKIIKLSAINQNTFRIGYIYGGIQSSSLNPFSANQTNNTNADNTIYEVWLTATTTAVPDAAIDGSNPFDIAVFSDIGNNEIHVTFNPQNATKVRYILTNNLGQIVQSVGQVAHHSGENSVSIPFGSFEQPMLLTFIFDDRYYVSKKIINP